MWSFNFLKISWSCINKERSQSHWWSERFLLQAKLTASSVNVDYITNVNFRDDWIFWSVDLFLRHPCPGPEHQIHCYSCNSSFRPRFVCGPAFWTARSSSSASRSSPPRRRRLPRCKVLPTAHTPTTIGVEERIPNAMIGMTHALLNWHAQTDLNVH